MQSQQTAALKIQHTFRSHKIRNCLKETKEAHDFLVRAMNDIGKIIQYCPTADIINGVDSLVGRHIIHGIREMIRCSDDNSMTEGLLNCINSRIGNCGEIAALLGIRVFYHPDFYRIFGDKNVYTYLLVEQNQSGPGTHVVVVIGEITDPQGCFILDPWIKHIDLHPAPGYRKNKICADERSRGFFGSYDDYKDFLKKHPTRFATDKHWFRQESQIGTSLWHNVFDAKILYGAIFRVLNEDKGSSVYRKDFDFKNAIKSIIESIFDIKQLNFFAACLFNTSLDSSEFAEPFLQHFLLNEICSFEELILQKCYYLLLLTKKKPDPSKIKQQDQKGKTILHHVVFHICSSTRNDFYSYPLEQLLQEATCDLTIRDASGQTPLDIILESDEMSRHDKIFEDNVKYTFLKLLQDERSSSLLTTRDRRGNTLLHKAILSYQKHKCIKKIASIVEQMRIKNISFETINWGGETPIQLAKRHLSKEEFECLFPEHASAQST